MSTSYSSCVAYFMAHGSFSDYMSCLLFCELQTFCFSLFVLSIPCFYALSAFFVFPTHASVMRETLKIKDVSDQKLEMVVSVAPKCSVVLLLLAGLGTQLPATYML